MKILVSLFLFCACSLPIARQQEQDTELAIRKIIAEQEQAWNRGDLPGFMAGYQNSPQLIFAGGGKITYGWQETLDRYQKKYSSKEKMGSLQFSEIQIFPIEKNAAVVLGRWQLSIGDQKPAGLFTLLFRKQEEGWRIVLDHSSSE